jgi:hypothetical protein
MTSTNVVRLTPGAQPPEQVKPAANGTVATALGEATGRAHSGFTREVRDSQWATAQEHAIQDRLQKYIGISPSHFEVECRTRCCRARLPRSIYDKHQRELQSSVGLGGGDDDMATIEGDDDGIIAAKICFPRTDAAPAPDRGAEREALLSTIRTELASCARGLAHEVVVNIELTLDDSGAVTKAETRSEPKGEPAAACVERAVVGAAAFAPAREGSWLPVNVTLPPR